MPTDFIQMALQTESGLHTPAAGTLTLVAVAFCSFIRTCTRPKRSYAYWLIKPSCPCERTFLSEPTLSPFIRVIQTRMRYPLSLVGLMYPYEASCFCRFGVWLMPCQGVRYVSHPESL